MRGWPGSSLPITCCGAGFPGRREVHSRLDADVFVPRDPPFLLRGGPQVRSEVATVSELGHRGQPSEALTYSITAFHTRYDHLRTQEIDASRTFLIFANEMEGETTGVEIWGTYQVSPHWRLTAGYTAIHDQLRQKAGSNDAQAPTAVGKNPAHAWQLRSGLNLAPDMELDVGVRRVGALTYPDVPAYTAFDARLGWRVKSNLELSLTGLNLLGSDHAEYGPPATRSRIPRQVFVQLRLQL